MIYLQYLFHCEGIWVCSFTCQQRASTIYIFQLSDFWVFCLWNHSVYISSIRYILISDCVWSDSIFCFIRISPICQVVIHVLTDNFGAAKNSPRYPENVSKWFPYNMQKWYILGWIVQWSCHRTKSNIKCKKLWRIDQGTWMDELQRSIRLLSTPVTELSHARINWCEVSSEWSAQRFIIE